MVELAGQGYATNGAPSLFLFIGETYASKGFMHAPGMPKDFRLFLCNFLQKKSVIWEMFTFLQISKAHLGR